MTDSLVLSVVQRAPYPDTPEQILNAAPELEALPIVGQRVLAMLRNERTTIDGIVAVLALDQALAASVLRSANSGWAMPKRRIANLKEGIARIGHRALGEVLMRACAGPMLDRGLPPYALPRRVAWRHAATTSVAARGLAIVCNIRSIEEASVAGLMHDVGKIILTSVLPEASATAVSLARSTRLPVWAAETQVLGFDHGAVGAALLRSWGLPDTVADAVEFHHQPGRTTNVLASIVSLADAAAHVVGAVGGGGACPQPDWDSPLALSLGASDAQIRDFLDALNCVDERGDLT
ncbi:MAG: hypothetical protein NVSMB2_15540 [Chloroflexota bacterium]